MLLSYRISKNSTLLNRCRKRPEKSIARKHSCAKNRGNQILYIKFLPMKDQILSTIFAMASESTHEAVQTLFMNSSLICFTLEVTVTAY